MLFLGLFQQRIVGEPDPHHLQVTFPGRRLGRDDLGRRHVQQDAVQIGQLVARLIDPVEVRVARKLELFRRGCCARTPGLQRRQVGVFGAVLPRHLGVQTLPVIDLVGLDVFGQLFRRLILLVELLHVVRRQRQQQWQRLGQVRQEIGLRSGKGIAHRQRIQHLEHRRFAAGGQLHRHTAAIKNLVVQHVIPAIGEILGRIGCPVRPAMPLAQVQGVDAVVHHIAGRQHVGLQLQLVVIAHQPGIAVDRDQPHIALPADDHPHRAAIAPGLAPHCRQINHAGVFRQPLSHRRQGACRDIRVKQRRLGPGHARQGDRGQQSKGSPTRDHARSSRASADLCASTRCPSPRSNDVRSARSPVPKRNAGAQSSDAAMLVCPTDAKSRRRSRSG